MSDGSDGVRPLFEESTEERQAREAFYNTGGPDSGEKRADHVIRSYEVGVSGAVRPSRQLDRRETCTVTIHDADGEVIASGEGTIGKFSFKEKEKDGHLFVTRGCKVVLE